MGSKILGSVKLADNLTNHLSGGDTVMKSVALIVEREVENLVGYPWSPPGCLSVLRLLPFGYL